MKLKCDSKCGEYFTFIQQSGWPHHFLPLCSCKSFSYIVIPSYIDKSQYRMFMKAATTKENKISYCYKEI